MPHMHSKKNECIFEFFTVCARASQHMIIQRGRFYSGARCAASRGNLLGDSNEFERGNEQRRGLVQESVRFPEREAWPTHIVLLGIHHIASLHSDQNGSHSGKGYSSDGRSGDHVLSEASVAAAASA